MNVTIIQQMSMITIQQHSKEKHRRAEIYARIIKLLALTGTETGYQGIRADWTLSCPELG